MNHPVARAVKLRGSGKWGASVAGTTVQPGEQIAIKTRRGDVLFRVVDKVIHRTADESIVSVIIPEETVA